VFIGVPGMKPVMQMRLAWSLATADGTPFQENAFFTPYELASFDPRGEGFGDLTVNLTPRAVTVNAAAPVSAEEGRRVYQAFGCVACHSIEGAAVDKLGPTFKGLFGKQRVFVEDTEPLTADEAYLRESILRPEAKIAPGYGRGGTGMPSYAGVLTDQQIDSLILFIKSLR
jgi:cytochrome c2